MLPYLDWLETIALHLQMISLPLQTVVIGAVIQKRQLNSY